MKRYQEEYDMFLITNDLQKRLAEFQSHGKDVANKTKSILVETVVIDEAPSFTDSMEVRDAQLA